jgi:hypothetical protein
MEFNCAFDDALSRLAQRGMAGFVALAVVSAVGGLGLSTSASAFANPTDGEILQGQFLPRQEFQPAPPPPPMQRGRRLHWVSDADSGMPSDPPRMSREERRELRREIHDAGRELYQRPRHGRGQ